jgi:hypothetical protein
MSTTQQQMNAYARTCDPNTWEPAGQPIDRAFGHRLAQKRGLPSYVKPKAPARRGDHDLRLAPEEVIHNPVLREQLEAQAAGHADPYAREATEATP